MKEMTLRQVFAAHALQGLLASGHYTKIDKHDNQPIFVSRMEQYYEVDDEKPKFEEVAPAVSDAWYLAELMMSWEKYKLTDEPTP